MIRMQLSRVPVDQARLANGGAGGLQGRGRERDRNFVAADGATAR